MIKTARFAKHEVIEKMLDSGLVPVFYNKDSETSKKIIAACLDGGAKLVEFTNRGDFAYDVFTELSKWCNESLPEVILGVGSIIDSATAAMYVNSGANFVVGPILNPDVARVCNRRKIAYTPGCGSVSEISQAEELGVDVVKIFPAEEMGGPSFIKNLLGPCPWAKIMPTGGVDPTWESISAWIKAGAACLGMGSKLISKELVAAGNFAAIQKKIEDCLWWIKKARGEPLFTGIERISIYPTKNASARQIADWYANLFGFSKGEDKTFISLSGRGPRRLEISKQPSKQIQRVTIRVANFDEACHYLTEKGVQLEKPMISRNAKEVYLKDPDKGGNRVHLLYTPP